MNIPMYQNPYMIQNQIQQPQNSITWVQGVEGAKAYQLKPNENAILMDSENNERFYIKTCDNVGMCSLRYFSYKEMSANPTKTEIDTSMFVTKEELTEAIKELKGSLKREQPIPAAPQKYNPTQRPAANYQPQNAY